MRPPSSAPGGSEKRRLAPAVHRRDEGLVRPLATQARAAGQIGPGTCARGGSAGVSTARIEDYSPSMFSTVAGEFDFAILGNGVHRRKEWPIPELGGANIKGA
ncbi:hypothetical protein GCM10023224_40170 [Streptomonospora halophila]|uniref:Uncharacterized protein n=1 Tax=Streptomonospora halophila TaxID=427369 RepID=A0ABP9GVU5_9ACTN